MTDWEALDRICTCNMSMGYGTDSTVSLSLVPEAVIDHLKKIRNILEEEGVAYMRHMKL